MISSDLQNIWELAFRQRDRLILIIVATTILSVAPIGYHIIVLNVPAKIIQNSFMKNFESNHGWVPSNFIKDFLW